MNQTPPSNDHGKVRVVFVELEGNSQTIERALQSFATTPFTSSQAPVAVPPASIPAALPAPAAAPPVRRVLLAKKKAATRPAFTLSDAPVPPAPPRQTLSQAIRDAVIESPRTLPEVMDAVRRNGFPQADSSTVSTILCQRRRANEMYKDEDLKWHMARH